MAQFQVVAVNGDARALVLRDLRGAYHVARVLADLPEVGLELNGSPPSLGFAILYGRDGQIHRLVFVLTASDQHKALAQLALPGKARHLPGPFAPGPGDRAAAGGE